MIRIRGSLLNPFLQQFPLAIGQWLFGFGWGHDPIGIGGMQPLDEFAVLRTIRYNCRSLDRHLASIQPQVSLSCTFIGTMTTPAVVCQNRLDVPRVIDRRLGCRLASLSDSSPVRHEKDHRPREAQREGKMIK